MSIYVFVHHNIKWHADHRDFYPIILPDQMWVQVAVYTHHHRTNLLLQALCTSMVDTEYKHVKEHQIH